MVDSKQILSSRLLCTICASYTAGICMYASAHISLFIILAVSALLLLVIKLKKLPYFFTALIVCASFSGGASHFSVKESLDKKFINQYTGRYLTISGTITDISYTDGDFQTITVAADSFTCLGETKKADFSARIFTDREKTFEIGNSIVFSDIFTPGKKVSVHSFDSEKHLRSKGISASFDPSTNYITTSEKSPGFFTGLTIFSQKLSAKLQSLIGGDEGTVATAITLGDTSAMPDNLLDIFRKCGISHIVAVSGMHLSILMSLFFFLAGHSRLHYKIRNIFGIFLVISYMLITGMSPSVTRAGIMIICVLSSAIFDRKEDVPTSFFLSAAIILAFNPYTIFSASFLLSFLSLAGIIVFAEPIRRIIARLTFLPDFIIESVAASSSAWLFTLPALIIMFGGISLVSLPANIIVLPFVGIIFFLSLAILATGFIPPLAWALAFIVKYLIKIVILCTNAITMIPFSYANVPKPGICDILVFILLVILLFLLLTGRKPGKYGFAALCLATLYISFTLTYSMLTYTVTFLDIGQGDCILIKAPGYKHYLIDTGPNPTTTLSALRSCGVNRLEVIFLSHPDKDHSGSFSEIVREIPTKTLVLPNHNTRGDEISAITSASLASGTEVKFTNQHMRYTFSGITSDILWPSRRNSFFGEENENSLVMKLNIKGNKFLFTGDIDSGAENDIIKSGGKVDAHVLKAAHHGSDGSSSDTFLQKVSPTFAVICAGNGNPYGHPGDETLSRLENSGSTVLRTDQMGDIKFTIDLFGNMRVKYESNR